MKRIITEEAYKVRAMSEMSHYFDQSANPETHRGRPELEAQADDLCQECRDDAGPEH